MNLSALRADVDFLCGSTSATYPVLDKTRNMNVAYNDVARLIWTSADGWQYDDTNNADLPIAKTSLVHEQQDYTLPTTAQRIHRVQVKDSQGNWNLITQKDIHDILVATEEFQGSSGLPLYYDMVARSIYLHPAPNSGYVTLSAGLEIFVDRNVTEFATSATTSEPGFARPFHRILSLAASIDFIKNPDETRRLAEQKQRLEEGLVKFYSKRNVSYKTQIKPASQKRWRQYK
jgi:hypothetical protein